jgi:hypothetical protein
VIKTAMTMMTIKPAIAAMTFHRSLCDIARPPKMVVTVDAFVAERAELRQAFLVGFSMAKELLSNPPPGDAVVRLTTTLTTWSFASASNDARGRATPE